MSHYKYIKLKSGALASVDFFCVIDRSKANKNREGTTTVCINNFIFKELSVYYRPERTWDDHMGNTPCGYFCVVPFPNGERKRVYMF